MTSLPPVLCNLYIWSPIVSQPTNPQVRLLSIVSNFVFSPFSFLGHSLNIRAPSSEVSCGENHRPLQGDGAIVSRPRCSGNSFAFPPPPKYFSCKQWHACVSVSHRKKGMRDGPEAGQRQDMHTYSYTCGSQTRTHRWPSDLHQPAGFLRHNAQHKS